MLKEDVMSYVDLHRALGFKYRIQSALLHNFVAFAEDRGDEIIRTQSVLDWAGLAPSPEQRRNRLLTVRRFAIAMKVEDGRHQIPPAEAYGHRSFRRCKPHVFTPEEIKGILGAAADLTPKGSLRPATFTVLFGLIAAAGLRSSEALALKMKDITEDGLIIRETKFRKSRLVPLHETAINALERYLVLRSRQGNMDNAVFLSLQGTPLSYSTVIAVFLGLLRSLKLRSGPGNPGPRLHDLRTHLCHSLA